MLLIKHTNPCSIFFSLIIFFMVASSVYDYIQTRNGGKFGISKLSGIGSLEILYSQPPRNPCWWPSPC